MKFSDELNLFLAQLHQDFFLTGDAMQGLSEILIGLGRARLQAMASHLDALLSQPYDLADLEEQWRKSGAEFWFTDVKQIPVFLAMVRDLAQSGQVRNSTAP